MSISHDVQVQCGEGAVRKRLRFVPAHGTAPGRYVLQNDAPMAVRLRCSSIELDGVGKAPAVGKSCGAPHCVLRFEVLPTRNPSQRKACITAADTHGRTALRFTLNIHCVAPDPDAVICIE